MGRRLTLYNGLQLGPTFAPRCQIRRVWDWACLVDTSCRAQWHLNDLRNVSLMTASCKTICFGAMKMNLPLLLPVPPSVNGPGHKWSGKKCRKKGGKKGASLLGAKDKRRVRGLLFPPSIYPYDDDDLLTKRAALILFR